MSDTVDRVNDEQLADLVLHINEEIDDHLAYDGGVGLSIPDARDCIIALEELQQHRARIAAHAAAHPERLSESNLDEIMSDLESTRAGERHPVAGYECMSMCREIQQRRAADLTPDDLAEARRIHEWCASPGAALSFEARRDIQRLIERILRAPGVAP